MQLCERSDVREWTYVSQCVIGLQEQAPRGALLNQAQRKILLPKDDAGDVDVDHDAQNVDDASDKRIAHQGWIEPQAFEDQRQ